MHSEYMYLVHDRKYENRLLSSSGLPYNLRKKLGKLIARTHFLMHLHTLLLKKHFQKRCFDLFLNFYAEIHPFFLPYNTCFENYVGLICSLNCKEH